MSESYKKSIDSKILSRFMLTKGVISSFKRDDVRITGASRNGGFYTTGNKYNRLDCSCVSHFIFQWFVT